MVRGRLSAAVNFFSEVQPDNMAVTTHAAIGRSRPECANEALLRANNIFLFIIICMTRIIDGIMQSATFLPFNGLPRYQITYINRISQFADVARGFDTLKQFFGLFVQDIQAYP